MVNYILCMKKSTRRYNMAVTFGNQKGGAQKTALNSYKYVEGDNKFRLVGDILARYVYWIEGENGKNIPFECLAFDRNAEAFNNKEKDWVKEFYPDMKCGWSYATQVIDPKDGVVKVVNLKKKLWEQIMSAAEDIGDPTNIDTGWDVVFKKVKTGPHAFNVEYQLQALKCKPRALDATEREAIADIKSMDDVMARPTADAQKALLDKIRGAAVDDVDEDAMNEIDIS